MFVQFFLFYFFFWSKKSEIHDLLKVWKSEFQRAMFLVENRKEKPPCPVLVLFFYARIFMIIRNVWTFSDISFYRDYDIRNDQDFQNVQDDLDLRYFHEFETYSNGFELVVGYTVQTLGVSDSVTGFNRESCSLLFKISHRKSRLNPLSIPNHTRVIYELWCQFEKVTKKTSYGTSLNYKTTKMVETDQFGNFIIVYFQRLEWFISETYKRKLALFYHIFLYVNYLFSLCLPVVLSLIRINYTKYF